MKKKILTVVGTRPEIIRLSSIIKRLNKTFDHKILFTGQNFSKSLSDYFFKNFSVKPNFHLRISNSNSIHAISDVFRKIDPILDKIKPDALFILGDTNSALCSIVAKKKKIPIFHYEAGNRCFDDRVPEELNRKIIDVVSDVNLTYSLSSKNNLLKEGKNSDFVYNIGSPLKEVFDDNIFQINKNNILQKLNLKEKNYILLSLHREENIDDSKRFKKMIEAINFLATRINKKVIFSCHPRTIKKFTNHKYKRIEIHKPFDFFAYNALQKSSLITISDSGSISEESYILKFPAINFRQTHERHEAMEKGIVTMSNINKEDLFFSYKIALKNNLSDTYLEDYEQKNVSSKIVTIINSYISYIKRKKYYLDG